MENIAANDEDDMEIGGEHVVDKSAGSKKLSFLDLYNAKNHGTRKEYPIKQTLLLAFQTFGIVYGDIGTSPLYTFSSITISNPQEADILGVLSLVFWTLTLIAVIKYALIVLRADDHGEGGTFALYSFLCRHLKFNNSLTIHNTRLGSDINLKYYTEKKLQSKAKNFLEGSKNAQTILTFVVLLGTCMVIGDGALTPAISVLSAVQGIQSRSSKITQEHVVILTILILLLVFLFQRVGTSKISVAYSPVMIVWLLTIAMIGVYNIATYYPAVFKGFSPHYIYIFFARNHKKGWELLGAIALCITGAEAMFADLGHFNQQSIQIAFIGLVYPALLLTYSGEAAYLIKHPENISTTFYSSVPSPIFWPVFIIATLAAVVGSQCLISASFSIVKQSMALGCFPRVTMIHTSDNYEGQVYSPQVNYVLMVLCLAIVAGFKGGAEVTHAYGVAVIWVMLITTCLMTVVMLVIWNTNILLIVIFLAVFLTVEVVYMSSMMNKVPQGGWVPLAISGLFLVISLAWIYGRRKKNDYEVERKMSLDDLNELVYSKADGNTHTIPRVPGICFFCTDLVNGIPPIIRHYVQHAGSLRQVLVIVTVRTLPIKSVLPNERFVVARMGPPGVYRCLVQYGYKDLPSLEGSEFVDGVLTRLKDFQDESAGYEMDEAMYKGGAVFVMGRTIVAAKESSSWFSKFVIRYLYTFMKNSSTSTLSSLKVPPNKFLQVGMLYEI